MILFHAKRDGTVTTTPDLVPQGSSMQDLVVVSEFDYAYCAIKLLPASGEYIEDIPCTPILQSDLSTIFTAALPPKATVVAGSVDYQLIFTAADGTTQTTLVGSFTVPRGVPVSTPPTVGELSAKTVADLYSILDNIYSLFAGHEGDIVKNNENIADLIRFKSSAGTVTIPKSEWTDAAPTLASVAVSGVDVGSIILMLPADETTRLTANNAKLSAYPVAFTPVGGDSSVSIFRAEAETIPDSDMTFAYIVLKTGFSFANPIAAIVGVDAYGEGGGGSGGGGSVDPEIVNQVLVAASNAQAFAKLSQTYAESAEAARNAAESAAKRAEDAAKTGSSVVVGSVKPTNPCIWFNTSGYASDPDPEPEPVRYTVSYNLTNCETPERGTYFEVDAGSVFEDRISPENEFVVDEESVTVTMGGADITSTAYKYGYIYIESVTGNIVITATAMAI